MANVFYLTFLNVFYSCRVFFTFFNVFLIFSGTFFTRKAPMLSARLSYRNSVCLSVCLSHG